MANPLEELKQLIDVRTGRVVGRVVKVDAAGVHVAVSNSVVIGSRSADDVTNYVRGDRVIVNDGVLLGKTGAVLTYIV